MPRVTTARPLSRPEASGREATPTPAEGARRPLATGGHVLSLAVIAVLAVIFALKWAQELLVPLVLCILLAFALDPPVSWLVRRGIARGVAAAMVLTLVVGIAGVLGYTLRDEGAALLDQLPEAAQKLRRVVREVRGDQQGTLTKMEKAAKAIAQAASEATSAPPPKTVTTVRIEQPLRLGDYLWWGTLGAIDLIGRAVVGLFLIYFLLLSGRVFRRKIVHIAGPVYSKRKTALIILQDIDGQIKRFLLVQLLAGIVVGVATWLALLAFGLRQAAFWGVVAGISNAVPYLGPVVVTGVLAVVAFMQFGALGMALAVAGTALAITSAEGYLLTPFLTSRAGRMNQVAVFVGLLFWGWVWGVWGLLLGLPVQMMVKAVCDHVDRLKPVGELLGE